MTNDTKIIFEHYIGAWNSHDVEKIATFFTEDGIPEDLAIGSACSLVFVIFSYF